MNLVLEHLKKSNKVLLTTHTNPDGDAIGSLIAMGLTLVALNKEISLYTEEPVPAVYHFISSAHHIVHNIKDVGSYDTAIILDCSSLERIGNACTVVCKIPVLINIDHHISNNRFGSLQLIDIKACAAAEIVYYLVKKLAVPISKSIASAIYTGILTDTGSFKFSNTNKAAFEICAEMTTLGAEPSIIAQKLYGQYPFARIKLLNLALNTIEISENRKLSIMLLTQEMFKNTDTRMEDGNNFVDYAKNIKDVKIAALIQELGNGKKGKSFHISLRSDETVDVAKLAASFGGGGHARAAGFDTQLTFSAIKTELLKIAQTL